MCGRLGKHALVVSVKAFPQATDICDSNGEMGEYPLYLWAEWSIGWGPRWNKNGRRKPGSVQAGFFLHECPLLLLSPKNIRLQLLQPFKADLHQQLSRVVRPSASDLGCIIDSPCPEASSFPRLSSYWVFWLSSK
jgi:hypothetical protein